MTVFATERARLLPAVRWTASARGAAILVSLAALYAIGHCYVGIVGDAELYMGRALADLDPIGVGRDIVFVHDGQSRFSAFSFLADPLVGTLGADRAAMAIAAFAWACLFAATLVLARVLADDRRGAIAVVVVAAFMPTAYGAGIFHYAEAAALPRPFAEAAVLAAVAALLARRTVAAGLFLAAALLIHPIMALAGVGTALVYLAWRLGSRARAVLLVASAAAAALASALGAAGVPLFARLVARVDPAWLDMLVARSPHLFPTLWTGDSFAGPVVQATTVLIVALGQTPARRQVLLSIVVSAAAQTVVAVVLGDVAHAVMALQVQSWRAVWLLGEVGVFCMPLAVARLWTAGADGRAAAALLGLAWLCPLGLAPGVLVCATALVLHAQPGARLIGDRTATVIVWGVVASLLLATAVKAVGWARFVGEGHGGTATALLTALQADLLVVPSCLGAAAWLVARPRRSHPALLASLTLAVATIAAATWNERSATATWAREDRFGPRVDVPGPRSSEILVVGGLTSSWFALGRPQYFSLEQAVSIVFSRPLAMEWRRRARVLEELGLVRHNMLHPWQPLTAADHIVVTAAQIAALCRRDDAPAAVIVPDRDDAPAPALPGGVTWAAAPPQMIVENFRPPEWHAIRGWVVAPCAATLAKTPAG